MNQSVRSIGRSFALLLPVVLVLSGTIAVMHVPWAGDPAGDRMLTASAERAEEEVEPRAPEDVLREQLVTQLRQEDPTAALTSLQQAIQRDPALSPHCPEIAQALGEAAVEKYGSARRAQQHARPVCDTAYAAGVAAHS